MTMTHDDGRPAMPTTSECVRSRKIVAHALAGLGAVMVLLGIVHFAGLPLILDANKNGTINLPSIEDKGLGFHLLRAQVANGVLMVCVDRCVFGAILLLCVPELKRGRRLAWRICMVIGSFTFVGYTALVWLVFERVHLPPLIMPAIGLLILVPLLFARRSFTAE